VLVVSEESGTVSAASGGTLTRGLDEQQVRELLTGRASRNTVELRAIEG
jgi:hypothetical protein